MIVKVILTGLLVGFVGTYALAGAIDCPPHLQLDTTYNQAKLACPDLPRAPFDRDDKSATVYFLCASQNTVVVGDMRTAKIVALLMAPERQGFLRDSVADSLIKFRSKK
jgi:hypothetical protein